MAKKVDEKFNIDDLDWPDLDFDEPSEPSDDRKPVSKVARAAAKGAKKVVFDEGRIKRVAKDVLPGAHSNVASAAFDVKDILRDIYGNVEGEAYKTKVEVQKSLRRFNKQTEGMFPDKMAGLLKKLGGDEGYYSTQQSEGERRQSEIDSNMAAIFGAREEAQTKDKEESAAKQLRAEAIGKKRYAGQMELFSSMEGSLRKLSDAADVDWRWKRKSLELQLQQNMLTGDIITGLSELRKAMSEELKAVVKNTGLPEAAKIELTEEFKRVNQQKLMESLGGGIYGGLGDYLARTGKGINKRFTSTVGNKLRDIRMGMSGGLDAAGDMLRMQAEQKQYGGEDDTLETILELAGGILADKGITKYGGKVKSQLAKLNLFSKSKGMVDNISTQGARLLNQQASLRGTHTGARGKVLDFARSMLDRTSLNQGLQGFVGGATTDYDEVKMRRLSTRTIVTIIPGLLARIHHEAVKARTGDDSVPMIRWDADTGTLTDSKTMISKVREGLVSKGTAQVNTEAVDKIIDGVVDSKSLTGTQRTMLRNHIAHLNMRQLPFDPKALATGKMQIFGEGSAKDKVRLRRLIGDQYGVDRMGEITGDKDEYHARVAGSARQIQTMRYNLNDPRKLVTDMIEKGHLEELVAIGAVVEKNGQMLIDYDKINEMRFNEGAGQDGELGQGAYAPKGMRPLGGNTVNNYMRKSKKIINNNSNAYNNSVTNHNSKTNIRNNSSVSNRFSRVTNNSSHSNIRNTQNNSLSQRLNLLNASAGGGWTGDDRYNSEYQSMALEEIIDQLENSKKASGWKGDQRYNSEYQTTALEEIIDVLQKGQTMSAEQMDTVNKSVQALVAKGTDAEEVYGSQYQTMVLEEIMDILQDGRQFTQIAGTEGATPGLISRTKKRFKDGLNKLRGHSLMGTAMGLKDKFMKRFTNNRERAMGLFSKAKTKVTDTWADITDWYKEGEWRPALEARKLAAKAYFDEATGKVVTKLSEVKGNIMEMTADGRATIAVRYEELMQGLKDGKGRKFLAKKANQARDFASGLMDKALGRHAATKDMILGKLTGAKDWTKSALWGMPDVYVKGEDKPRLLSVLAKNGSYIVVGGKSVRTLNDITGAVADRVGNIVLSEDDIAKGLVDSNGEPLEKYAKGLKGIIDRVKAIPGSIVGKFSRGKRQAKVAFKRGMKRVRGAFKGLGGMLRDFTGGIMGKFRSAFSMLGGDGKSVEDEHLDVAYAQLEVQGMILDQMVASKKSKRKKKWDTDGNGDIDGSWRDLLARRAKKKEDAHKEGGTEKKPSKVMSWLGEAFGKAVGAVGTAISGLGTMIWDGIKWIGTLIAAKAMGGNLGDMFRRGGGRGGRGGAGAPGGRGGRRAPAPRGGRGGPRVGRGKAGMIAAGLGMVGMNAFAGDNDMVNNALDVVDTASMTRTATQGAARTAGQAAARGGARAGMQVAGRVGMQFAGRAALMLLNPWVAGAVVVGAIGYGLYKWWDSSKPRPLQAIRLAQYGVDREDGDTAGRYLEFEEWVKKNTKTNGQGQTTLQGVKQEDILNAMQETIGGTDENPDLAMNWFSYRFMPVYAAWARAANSVGKADKIEALDDDLSKVEAKKVYDLVKSVPSQTRAIGLANPSDKTMTAGEVQARILEKGKLIDDAAAEAGGGNATAVASTSAAVAELAAASNTPEAAAGGAGGGGKQYTNIPGIGAAGNVGAMMAAMTYTSDNGGDGGFSELKIDAGPLDPLRSVRMKVYGLTTLDLPLVNAILRLECSLNDGVKYSGKNTAIYRGDAATMMDNAMASFGVDTRDERARPNFQQWFESRFMPAYLTYMGAAHEAGLRMPLRAHLNGSMTQQYFAGNAMVAASTTAKSESISVWKTGLHPIYGKEGNRNAGSVVGNMEALLANVDAGELSEISGEKGGILDKAQKMVEGLGNRLTNMKNSVVNTVASWVPEGMGNKIKSFFGSDGPAMGGGATPATPTSTMNTPGGSYTPTVGGGASINFDPAGGKNGNVNDVPLPTGPKGFEEHMALIDAVAKMTGVDPGVLAGLFATESSFDSRAVPGTSSAKGLGQFIDSTWDSMIKKYGHLFGIKPGTSANDPRANALMTVMYMKENADIIKKDLGKQNVTDVDLYLAHFLGAGGYKTLYKNPNAIAATLLPVAAKANKSIFYVDGDLRRPRTGAEVMAMQANKQIKNRNRYGPLMHAYVKERGGKVDDSIFANAGADMGSGLGTAQAGAVAPSGGAAANDDEANTGAPNLPNAPTGGGLVAVDAGGMPEIPTPPTTSQAAAVRTKAALGSDITQAPMTPVGEGGTQQQVAKQSNERANVAQNQASSQPLVGNDVGTELVRLGTSQENYLRLISEGIDFLVKVAGQSGGNSPGAMPRGPMSVRQASSV